MRTEGHSALAFAVGKGVVFLALLYLFVASPARAEEDELRFIELYNGEQAEPISVGRSPRPASQTAENITVVTAKEIEALNAHTIVEVLNLVAGVHLDYVRTPGTTTNIFLQGSNYNHILVLIDNVPFNNLTDNFPDIGAITVQMIERIEIVKGAASSSWGNALGGVINIITKSPASDRPLGGQIAFSAGKAATIDGRVELTGTGAGVGYYLTGGKLRSDGLLPNNMTDHNYFYGKLHYELPRQGSITATTFLSDSEDGLVQVQPRGFNGNYEARHLLATLTAQYPLSDRFTLEAMFRARRMDSDLLYSAISGGAVLRDVKSEESSDGGVVKLSYLDDLQRVLAGVDYDHLNVHVTQPQRLADILKRNDDRIGVYLNDTITLGRFAITPSVRYDHTEINGNLFSPSLGVTYAVTENSVLRAYTAKGYGITSLNREDALEKVWTSQFGIESADIPYLWLKGTLFHNETGNISLTDGSKQRQQKQGYEVELRTVPILATSFSLGYTYVDAEDRDTDAVVRGIPRHTLNLGVKYEDSRHLRIVLTGHYIDWNLDPSSTSGAKYNDIIWDLHLAKKLIYSDTVSAELFGSIRNLFNGEQYNSSFYRNPRLWGEAGIRCAF